ncbi:MAG: hypothetical protein Q4D38_14470 [Planctomycetia bacterium]|nr:hypothetical protein [Planctomycetia bacterium]
MKNFVLNLKESKARRETFFERYPTCLPPVEVWEAEPPERCETPAWWRGTPPFNSHRVNFLNVLRACEKADEIFMFWEDDCIFSESFEDRYNAFMREVPDDWECLNLCTLHMNSTIFPPRQISENVLRPVLGFNTNAMLFSPSGARKMRDQLEKPSWMCKHIVEQQLGYLYMNQEFKVYAPIRNFVGQAACYSELCERERCERWYNDFLYIDRNGDRTWQT